MPKTAPPEPLFITRVLHYDRTDMQRRGHLGGKRAAAHPDRAAICAKARAAYQRQLEERVDPDNLLAPEERQRLAGELRRDLAREWAIARRAADETRAEGGAA
jgi:hypothetical protein